MNNFFYKNSLFIRCITFFLIFFFIAEPTFAARTSQYGSIKQSTDVLGATTQSHSQSSVKSLNGSGTDTTGQQMNVDQTNLSMTQSGQFLQIIQTHVVGEVAVPGVFKTPLSTRASELIQRAMPNRTTVRLYTIRNGESGKEKTYDLYRYYFYGDLKQNPYVQDGDVIRVPKHKGVVVVEGPVARPGEFELYYEKNLSQVLALAGGTTNANANHLPIKVIRFFDTGKKDLISIEQKKSELKKFQIQAGDTIIVPDIVNANKKFDYSLEKVPGENIIYPTAVADVFVVGAVYVPGPYPYKSHMTVKDYVGFAGAMADANLRGVKIFRDGKKKRFSMYSQVQAGDVIIVREKNLDVFMKYVSVFSTIIGLSTSAIVLKTYIDRQ